MKSNTLFKLIIFLGILVGAGLWYSYSEAPTIDTTTMIEEDSPTPPTLVEDTSTSSQNYKDLVFITTPLDQPIQSPFMLEGQARGMWYFEASFPVVLTNWDGLILAEGYAEAQEDWMTEEYVPFKVTLSFETPYKDGDPDFMKRGSLILKKDNPSGLPEKDDAFESTIFFE